MKSIEMNVVILENVNKIKLNSIENREEFSVRFYFIINSHLKHHEIVAAVRFSNV